MNPNYSLKVREENFCNGTHNDNSFQHTASAVIYMPIKKRLLRHLELGKTK